MKFLHLTIFLLASLLMLSCQSKTQSPIQVSNPLTMTDGKPVVMGDPFILHASDGKFYAYGTTEGNMDGFNVYVSDDLTNWTLHGQCYKADPNGWTTDCFWAPEVYERNGKFYMLFSSNWKENPTHEDEIFRIGVAVSDSPTGPFKELSDKPIFDPGYPIIDGNLYFADDGRVYLYYSRCCYKHAVESELAAKLKAEGKYDEIEESWIYGVEIKPDFSGAIGEPVQLLVPPYELGGAQEWESRSAMAGEANRRWNEGSFIFKHGDTYYIMYSANFYGGPYYAVGYATGKSPLGPFTKAANNPVLERNNDKGGEVYCTGHNMVLTMPDGTLYTVYHGRTARTDAMTHNGRVMFIDKMEILPDGQLVVHGPTTSAAQEEGWTNLFDMNLSQWRIWESYQLKDGYRGQAPTDADGNVLPFIGYDKNQFGVFTMEEQDGEPVLHVQGAAYGCVISNQSYRNYHLKLQVKFGTQHWEPRLDKAEDSGLLYHSIGEPGVDYWKAWMRSIEFQMMESGTDEGNTGDFWSIAGSRADIKVPTATADVRQFASPEERKAAMTYDPNGTWKTVGVCYAPDYNSPKDQWTQVELICYEGQSLHIVNGQVAMALKNLRYVEDGQEYPLVEGKLQLQSEAGEVFYRRAQIKEITELPQHYAHYFE